MVFLGSVDSFLVFENTQDPKSWAYLFSALI